MPKASLADFRRHFGQWKNFKVLFGAAWSWFALDVAFYGLGLNSAVILQTIGFGPAAADPANPAATLQQSLHNVAVGNIILALGGLLPGYYFTFAFIDSWGRNLPVPPILMSLEKPTCAMMAPSFPLAAQIPCAVDLYRVGKTSPGMMNVVVLGPKFWKKLAMQYW